MDELVLAFGRGELQEKALYLLLVWLASTVICSYLSDRKGYGERPGLAAGLFLSALGIVVWLLWPPRKDSKWKLTGAFGSGKGGMTVAEARAEAAHAGDAPAAPGGAGESGDPRT